MFAGRQPNRCTRFVFCGPDKRFHVCAVRFFQMQNALSEAFSGHKIPLRNQTQIALFLPARQFGDEFTLAAKPGQTKKHQSAKTHQGRELNQKKRQHRSNQGSRAQHKSGLVVEYENHLFQPLAVPQMENEFLICMLHSNRHKRPPLSINASIIQHVLFLCRDYTHHCTQHKNRLPCRNQSGYISAAPHKTGAGIGTPQTNRAHDGASGFFVRTVSPRLFRTRIMVGRAGPASAGPGPLLAGSSNPVRLTTPSLEPLDGEFSKLTNREATPWQTANSTALSRSVVTSRLKSTADFPAHSASLKSCTSICCMSVAANFQTSTHPLFSAIWRMICASFNSSSSSKTNPINSCSGPFLHLAAGGLRTSVTRGLPQ